MIHNPFEDKFLRGIDRRVNVEREKKELEEAYKRARKLLNDAAIDPNDFDNLYDEETIKNDIAHAAKMDQKFEAENMPETQESKKYATVLEGIVHEGIDKEGWFGDDARAIKTSRFDDIENGVDEVVEIRDKDALSKSHLALAVDVTFSNQIAKKIKKIKDEIDSGKLGEVKYFLSEESEEELGIPRVVIGTEINNVKKIQGLWIKKEDLTRHPFHLLMLEEVLKQLDEFAKYALRKEKKDIAEVYKSAANTVRTIYRKKIKDEEMSPGIWEDDRVFAAIKKELKNLK